MADTAAADSAPQNNNDAASNNKAAAKGRGRPKKGKLNSANSDVDSPDIKATNNSSNNVAAKQAQPAARGRTSQRKASLAASNAMREQAQGKIHNFLLFYLNFPIRSNISMQSSLDPQ